ncbi:Probable transcriptional regulatory protein YebC [hydrothermal vent metagenome]|uniref:Probable transcriptional regulatory protein YebC n=1 Tax=hydrothermal vent metagenome TaxID=652676 RepID=A0A3B0QUN6_9ZZZZ
MSGHSKWANIKHKKSKTDAKRGKIFSKLVKEIMVAAKMGGSDQSANARLRTAIDKAKAENMPGDNIDRAVKKGAGELSGVVYEEGTYEGYGPGGVAVIVDYMTDNKNRTVGEVRRAFTKHGGSLGESGSVGWIFEKRGIFTFDSSAVDEDALMESALEAGADDVVNIEEDGVFEVYTAPTEFHTVKSSLEEAGFESTLSIITMIPKTTVKVEGKVARKVLKMMDDLEDLDDVQEVYANFDMSAEDMEADD